MATRLRKWIVPALGAVALATGLVMVSQSRTSFGWFAYAPLSDATFSPDFVSQPLFIAGIAVVILGVAAIAGWVGFRLGHRAATSA